MSEIDATRGSFSRRDFLAQAAAMLIVSGVDIASAFVPAESRLLPMAVPTEAAPVITTRPWSMPGKWVRIAGGPLTLITSFRVCRRLWPVMLDGGVFGFIAMSR